jgi:16S rRNA (cytosine1402-N4)-methyltransferase
LSLGGFNYFCPEILTTIIHKLENNYSYHKPVMLTECIKELNINPEGIYVDVTFGGGGHSREILSHLTTGKLFAFDQDEDAKKETQRIESPNFTFIEANFRFLEKYLRLHGVRKVDGVLADLGISSYQIDTAERGFSTRFDAELDMRMNQQSSFTARKLVNTYSPEDLHKVLGQYGEIRNARTAALAIVAARSTAEIITINDLKSILQKLLPRGKESKYLAQVFQALRIEVNEEMRALEDFLRDTPNVLNPEGRLVVMSYHSLEDRLVKNFFRSGKFRGDADKDFYGNDLKPLKALTRKPIEASAEEVKLNPRARSAKLRVATLN